MLVLAAVRATMNVDMGAYNLARQAERTLTARADEDFLFFEGIWHAGGSLADRAARFAAGLRGLGVRPGDRLLVLMANCPEVLVTYLAAWRVGAVVTPLVFLATPDEVRHVLADSDAVAVVTTADLLPHVGAALAGAALAGAGFAAATSTGGPSTGVHGVRFVVTVGVAESEVRLDVPVLDFEEVSSATPADIVDRGDRDLAALLYTGGTTGRAKGVPLSHANLYWCGSTVALGSVADGPSSTLLPLPLAHAYGLLVTCAALHGGDRRRLVLMRWFDPAGWVELAQRHRVQRTTLVPSMIQMLLAQPLEEADLSALTVVSSGAAPLAEEIRVEFETRVPSAAIYEGYGCTETASLVAANPVGARRAGSVGLPVPGCSVTIRDDTDQELPPGRDGEICVRSPGVTTGYWHAPDESEAALRGAWLRTGDIGHLDADGYLYVVDRKKDLIIRGGFNVYPRDVEDVLLSHPAVAQAGVVGRPDGRLGEEVVAFVSLRPGATADTEELLRHARTRLAATKYPREITIVPAVPLTSVGKLDRKRLRGWAGQGEGRVSG